MLEGAKSMGAGAATIASAGAAIGIGNVLSSSIHSVARNQSLAKQLFGYAILGFALTEAIASFAPMMAFEEVYIIAIALKFPCKFRSRSQPTGVDTPQPEDNLSNTHVDVVENNGQNRIQLSTAPIGNRIDYRFRRN
ncbi:ATP synthase subunit 9, mitochondrial-like [Capsicum annuum]|uniref:ATP synthase subunit 9, mitochondrial-like n=1 Tax=Capsicum annuum TaxID=4072 RepID=UPI001FB1A0BE|nr:ATP synthase subunit 9, mitochondrial-like [Capsicum annuum]